MRGKTWTERERDRMEAEFGGTTMSRTADELCEDLLKSCKDLIAVLEECQPEPNTPEGILLVDLRCTVRMYEREKSRESHNDSGKT